MTLDEAIEHAKEKSKGSSQCAKDHRQLVKWLTDLKKKLDDELIPTDLIEEAPSAEAEGRLYIKIYADDEPSVMAKKLYQICGETQNGEVAEWLKEYFPSAEPRYTGCNGCVHYDQQQTALICRDCKRSYRDMYEE